MSTSKRQSTLRTIGKISKVSVFPAFLKPANVALAPSNKLCFQAKRKRDESDDDEPAKIEGDELAFDKVIAKKVRPTPHY